MMKLNGFGPALLAAMALMAFTASSATATTLEVAGVKQTGAVSFKTKPKVSVTITLSDTSGFFANSCTASTIEGKTSVFTGATVSGPYSTMSFSSCKEEPVVVDTAGSFSIENISGTTNGTVRSIGAKVTSPSPFGSLTCVTAASPGTDIGTLTGVASGTSTTDINAALNCGLITARLTGTYETVSPSGLGVTS
jgi:hypothetical protein